MKATIRRLLGRPSRRLSVAVTMIVALVLAACGGGDAAQGPQASSASSASNVTTSEPSAGNEPKNSADEPSTTAVRSIAEHTNPPDTDTTTSTPTSTTTSSTSATTPSTTSSTTTAAERTAGIDAWLGTFEWTEFAEGDPGSNQTIVHELILTSQSADGSLTGTFTQSGFQTNISLEVAAYPGETGVTIFATTDGPPLYTADQRLFALSGDPNAPTTSLGAVQPFLAASGPQTGSYFTR